VELNKMIVYADRDSNHMKEQHGITDLVTDYPSKKRILQEVTHDDAPQYEGDTENTEKPL
tara:strand:+ start:210 stop:389 length:180 start_codon:yes stop_codon:yes gene_type:complete